MKARLCVTALLLLIRVPAFGQLDQGGQIASLADVGLFGLVVDIEAPRSVTLDPGLDIMRLSARLADRIEAVANRRPSPDPLDEGHPYLYVHVNAHDAGGGLIPFAVNASFIQETRRRAGGEIVMAITWESGFVGLVSYDRLSGIADASEGLVEEFVGDLATVSGGSR